MKKIIVGKIYAEWCGHCQNLHPEWLKMKKELKMLAKKKQYVIEYVEIEEIETDKMNDFKTRFPGLTVNGYPTIFKNTSGNQLEYYGGDRSASKMKDWVLGKTENHTKSKGMFYGGKRKTVKRKKNQKNKTLYKTK
jgi:protein disulfide-isomerase A6